MLFSEEEEATVEPEPADEGIAVKPPTPLAEDDSYRSPGRIKQSASVILEAGLAQEYHQAVESMHCCCTVGLCWVWVDMHQRLKRLR